MSIKCLNSILVAILTFVVGPMYILSRFIALLFPWFIVLYLYFGYDTNICMTGDIYIFQKIMISVYLALCTILSVLFVWNCSEQYLMAHLLPGSKRLPEIRNEQKSKEYSKNITNHYYNIQIIPIREAILIDAFGIDIGPIILSFLPFVDDYVASSEDMVKVTTVI